MRDGENVSESERAHRQHTWIIIERDENMQVLESQVFLTKNNKVTIRVKALNDKGQVIIGVSEPTEFSDVSKRTLDLINQLNTTQTHVPHISPLGKE